MTRDHECDLTPEQRAAVMARQFNPETRPAPPDHDPEMTPRDVARLIEATRRAKLLPE